MTRDQIINSTILKKRFIRDCGLPITVYDNPYFVQRLEIIDPLFGCLEKWDRYCNEVATFSSEQSYLEWYNTTKDKIINAIKNHPIYQEFNALTLSKTTHEVSKNNLYVEPNNGRLFISIDMKKANFSSMQYFSHEIFNCDTWEEFVGQFTDSKHFADSKYIRQVIFGACNPKRQIKYESYLMERIYTKIKQQFTQLNVFSLGEDEIIIPFVQKQQNNLVIPLSEIEDAIPDDLKHIVRVEVFSLHKAGNYGWFKIFPFSNKPLDFKCVDAEIFHQLWKHYQDIEITEDDLVFYHNGQLAKFLKEIESPWIV